MPRRGERKTRRAAGDPGDPGGFAVLSVAFWEALRVKNYSEATIENRSRYLDAFVLWCEARGITRPQQVTNG